MYKLEGFDLAIFLFFSVLLKFNQVIIFTLLSSSFYVYTLRKQWESSSNEDKHHITYNDLSHDTINCDFEVLPLSAALVSIVLCSCFCNGISQV